MEKTQLYTIVAISIYAITMVLIGCFSYRRSKTLDGFLLGNRNIGAWASAFAYGTAYFSAVIFIGYAGTHGWNIGIGAIWIGIGNAILGCLLSWLFFAKRTNRMTRKLSAKTMPEFFAKRYDSKGLKLLSAVIIFVFLVPYSAAVYKGLGSIFNAVFPGIEVWVWMLTIACLTAVYLVAGGYAATAYTDFVQGIIMIVGVICVVCAVLSHETVGGITGLFENLSHYVPTAEGDTVTGSQLANIFGGSAFKFLCVNIMLTSFGTWGLPQMISKFYAIKDDAAIKRGTIISTAFCLIIGCGAYLIGSTARLILPALPAGGLDSVIPEVLMTTLSGSNLTIALFAVIIVLLLSASMSTLEAVVLTSASAVAVDFIPAVRKNVKQENQMLLTRLLCLLFVALSYIFATQNIPIIVSIMSFSWGVVSGCFIGPYIWGIYSKKTTKAGAYAGMIAGLLTVGVSTLVITLNSGFSAAAAKSPEMGVAAMAVSFVIVPLVSMLTKKAEQEKVDEIFSCYEEA